MTTMTCLCGATHDVDGSVECDCGLVLMETEELTEDATGCDDEPGDIDSDEGFNPYTGSSDDDGYDTGCFDD